MWIYDEQWVNNRVGVVVKGRYGQVGRIPGDDAAYCAWPGRVLADIYENGMDPEASLAKHDRELCQALGIVIPFPPVPNRQQVCTPRIGFQGCVAHTSEYGDFPMFGPETTTLSDPDLAAYCQDILNQGFNASEIAVSWQYAEPGFLMPVPGRDLSQSLPELVRRVAFMLQHGMSSVTVFLAGDGRSKPRNPDGSYPYNDPVGHTYGYEWLMDNLPRIIQAFQFSEWGDLTQYVLFVPGYDGVFYGWGNNPDEPPTPDLQPTRVRLFGELFRRLCPNGYLGIEHNTGHIPCGEGDGDYQPGGLMQNYDVILSEFDADLHQDNCWQIVARLANHYNRPTDQPAGDDPNPPRYTRFGTPRGEFYYNLYEFLTYDWTRGHVSLSQVQTARVYLQTMAPNDVVC